MGVGINAPHGNTRAQLGAICATAVQTDAAQTCIQLPCLPSPVEKGWDWLPPTTNCPRPAHSQTPPGFTVSGLKRRSLLLRRSPRLQQLLGMCSWDPGSFSLLPGRETNLRYPRRNVWKWKPSLPFGLFNSCLGSAKGVGSSREGSEATPENSQRAGAAMHPSAPSLPQLPVQIRGAAKVPSASAVSFPRHSSSLSRCMLSQCLGPMSGFDVHATKFTGYLPACSL